MCSFPLSKSTEILTCVVSVLHDPDQNKSLNISKGFLNKMGFFVTRGFYSFKLIVKSKNEKAMLLHDVINNMKSMSSINYFLISLIKCFAIVFLSQQSMNGIAFFDEIDAGFCPISQREMLRRVKSVRRVTDFGPSENRNLFSLPTRFPWKFVLKLELSD